jgi:hypothetical protein
MERYKKGQWVRYIKHYDKSLRLKNEDKQYFQIGRIYQIHYTNKECYPTLKVDRHSGIIKQVSQDQIEEIPDTKINRVLYPEAFGGTNE